MKERILYGTNKSPDTDGCWEWMHGKSPAGYGITTVDSRQQTAHRLAWSAWRGKIPDGACVLHKCDNPACCNPRHLFLGSQADNMRDMGAKGRQWLSVAKAAGKKIKAPNIPNSRRARGEAVGTSKLTAKQVRAIYKDPRKQRSIAQDYGVTQAQVWRIKNGISWVHVTKHSAKH